MDNSASKDRLHEIMSNLESATAALHQAEAEWEAAQEHYPVKIESIKSQVKALHEAAREAIYSNLRALAEDLEADGEEEVAWGGLVETLERVSENQLEALIAISREGRDLPAGSSDAAKYVLAADDTHNGYTIFQIRVHPVHNDELDSDIWRCEITSGHLGCLAKMAASGADKVLFSGLHATEQRLESLMRGRLEDLGEEEESESVEEPERTESEPETQQEGEGIEGDENAAEAPENDENDSESGDEDDTSDPNPEPRSYFPWRRG